jgi:G3E family GTPase|tara:strand:+ start:169 stop:408 length:240 start_codon:yes stop_codon:yes gene_type:complete
MPVSLNAATELEAVVTTVDANAVTTTVDANAVTSNVYANAITSNVFARAVLILDDQIDAIDIIGELAFNQYTFNTQTLG